MTKEEYWAIVDKKYSEVAKLKKEIEELTVQYCSENTGKKEFKIGEVFQFGLAKLKVKKLTPFNTCDKCAFNKSGICGCIDKYIGGCFSIQRKDKTDVIFVKVED